MNCGGRSPARMATETGALFPPSPATACTCSKYSLLGVKGRPVVRISPERRSTSKQPSPPGGDRQQRAALRKKKRRRREVRKGGRTETK